MVTVDTESGSVTQDRGPCVLIDGEGRGTCAGMDRHIVAGVDGADAHPDLDEGTVTEPTTQLSESRSRGA